MKTLYSFLMRIMQGLLPIAALFSEKIQKFYRGRKEWKTSLASWKDSNSNQPLIVIHCSSLGEYEMVVPLIKEIKSDGRWKVLITFFSPSGYDQRNKDPLPDGVFYLPVDTKKNARLFLDILNPEYFIIVKYDLWFNLLDALCKRRIKTILVNGFFRQDHFLSKGWASGFRKSLQAFEHFFVQNAQSEQFLKSIGFSNVSITSDMRFDQVVSFEQSRNQRVENFKQKDLLLVLGSSWPAEESLLIEGLVTQNLQWKIVIVPHDVGAKHISNLEMQLKDIPFSKWSEHRSDESSKKVLLIDEIGWLKQVYQSADACFIGGGFSGNVHNILEAAIVGMPLACGPISAKFPEIDALQNHGVLSRIKSSDDLIGFLKRFAENKEDQVQIGRESREWVLAQQGATQIVMNYLLQHVNKGDAHQ